MEFFNKIIWKIRLFYDFMKFKIKLFFTIIVCGHSKQGFAMSMGTSAICKYLPLFMLLACHWFCDTGHSSEFSGWFLTSLFFCKQEAQMCLTQIVSPDFSVNECGLFFKHSPLLNFLQKVSVKYCLLLVTELGFLNCFAIGNDLTSTSIKESPHFLFPSSISCRTDAWSSLTLSQSCDLLRYIKDIKCSNLAISFFITLEPTLLLTFNKDFLIGSMYPATKSGISNSFYVTFFVT